MPGEQEAKKGINKITASIKTVTTTTKTKKGLLLVLPSTSEDSSSSSQNSFGGDYFGVFQGYLRRDEGVEDTKRRLKLVPQRRRLPQKEKTRMAQTRKTKDPHHPHLNKLSNASKTTRIFVSILRTLLLDIPLMLLFAFLVASWLIRSIYSTYYEPLIARATRTDAQLLDEFTYYERQCTEYDLTTRNIQDLLLSNPTTNSNNNNNDDNTKVIDAAVDIMMKHGATVIPNILQPNTTAALRDFIVAKNRQISGTAQAYPMSQGERRLSYGIDAAEHFAVSDAIAQVATHPVLQPLLQALLGDDDPASAEITSITAFAGAQDQVWHQDTKQDGNAIKFARTYSHSYSLFLPLQDTSEKMGATDICPGTHYCLNDIAEMCEHSKMGLHLVHKNNKNNNDKDNNQYYFPAGAGALLNQHVWHRGGAHTDYADDAPERIVFILSFLARPSGSISSSSSSSDVRQLSRGTYFHQKWLMWGHTWRDLMTPATSMRYPFSVLRCLSLWKPADAHWGYDLITSGFLRFANEQLEDEDFADRFLPRLDQLGFPEFLRGRHLDDDASQRDTWHVFICETLDKVYDFAIFINLIVHAVYLLLLLAWAVSLRIDNHTKRRQRAQSTSKATTVATTTDYPCLRRALLRLVLTHGTLLLLGCKLWIIDIGSSEWGKSVKSGRALMRPFPAADSYTRAQEIMVSNGPTTLPTRNDVLIGTRFDAEFLGSYSQWLDYHPGNVKFRQAATEHASMFAMCKRYIGPSAARGIIEKVVDPIRNNLQGRFLQQDFRTGDWRVMTESEVYDAVAEELIVAAEDDNGALSVAYETLDRLIADNRFGPRRTQRTMAHSSQLRLWHLRRSLVLLEDRVGNVNNKEPLPESLDVTAWSLANAHQLRLSVRPPQVGHSVLEQMKTASRLQKLTERHPPIPVSTSSNHRGGQEVAFQVGSLVWVHFEEDEESDDDDDGDGDGEAWFPGAIMRVDDDSEWFHVAFEDNTWDEGVSYEQLHPYKSITEGDFILGCFEEGLQDCWPGTVVRCLPGGYVSIAYDDGDFDALVPPSNYYQPPFMYEGPFFY